LVKSNFVENLVLKPWGYEYLAFESPEVALWVLHIDHQRQTSMHCHPTKQTGFVLLQGSVELSFIADKKTLVAPDKQMIRRGLFHSTKATSEQGAIVLELETPNNKRDLVRLDDPYGRETKGYESATDERPKRLDCLWLDAEMGRKTGRFNYFGADMKLEKIFEITDLMQIADDDICVFLAGGLQKVVDSQEAMVTVPGDIGRGRIVKQVAERMSSCAPGTLALTISC